MFLFNGVDTQVLWKNFLDQLEIHHLNNKLQAHKAIKISAEFVTNNVYNSLHQTNNRHEELKNSHL